MHGTVWEWCDDEVPLPKRPRSGCSGRRLGRRLLNCRAASRTGPRRRPGTNFGCAGPVPAGKEIVKIAPEKKPAVEAKLP
jgi:hypothetical protein